MKRVLLAFNILLASTFVLLVQDISTYYDLYGHLEITFLDVGQGDSILIKTPSNSFGLIDGGRGKRVIEELEQVLPDSFYEFSFIIITHPDADHAEGIIHVLNKYDTKRIFLNEIAEPTEIYHNLSEVITSKNIPNYTLSSENDFVVGELLFDIIWPSPELNSYRTDDLNDISTGFIMQYKNLTFYSAGDLSSKYEEKVFNTYKTIDPIDIFKAGHHGSKTSSSKKMLEISRPKVAIFSAGLNNSYGHPHKEVIQNFNDVNAQQFRTDIMGRISVETDGMEFALISCEKCEKSKIKL
ncbi:MAG: hypothetical protein Kow0081_3730 [Candidatus Dojkabacteria bacterium]